MRVNMRYASLALCGFLFRAMIEVAQEGLDLFLVETCLVFNDSNSQGEFRSSSCTEGDGCLLATVDYHIQDQCIPYVSSPEYSQQPTFRKLEERIGERYALRNIL